VWKLSGEAECTLEGFEVETLRDVIIRREKRDQMEVLEREKVKRDCEENPPSVMNSELGGRWPTEPRV